MGSLGTPTDWKYYGAGAEGVKIDQQELESKKARALMEVIDRMIQRYRNAHDTGDLDENLFRLFLEAKDIHHAQDVASLEVVVKRVQMIKI